VLVMGFIDADEIRTAIEAANGVRWVSTHAAGVDHYPLERICEKGMVLTKGSGAGAGPIAEYVVLCILSAAMSFPFFLASSGQRRRFLSRLLTFGEVSVWIRGMQVVPDGS
jgi:phosphoglycerate dehydrogenase-like enzyme